MDAHPNLLIRPDGKVWRPRIQSYDSTFGLQRTDRIRLHLNSVGKTYGGLPANPVFDDTKSYWSPPSTLTGNLGWSSVRVPHTGTVIRVLAQRGVVDDGRRQVQVAIASVASPPGCNEKARRVTGGLSASE